MNRALFILITVFTFFLTHVLPCPSNCIECDPQRTICYACHINYEIDVFGACQQNTIPNCVVYGPGSSCFGCQPTFRLELNKCVKDYTGCVLFNSYDMSCFDCGMGTSIGPNSQCEGVINCQEYASDNKTCVKCSAGYRLENKKCMDATKGCSVIRAEDGVCQKCKEGFTRNGYLCIAVEEILPQCYLQDINGKCMICKNGYKMFNDTKDCYTDPQYQQLKKKYFPPQQEIQYCSIKDPTNPFNCLICQDRYFPSSSKCVPVSKFCEGYNVQTGLCLSCLEGLKLEAGKCRDKNCQNWTEEGGCAKCSQGYQQNKGVCAFSDQFCLKKGSDLCLECVQGHYVAINGRCALLPQFCSEFSTKTNRCLSCISSNYQLDSSTGRCVKKQVIEFCQVPDPLNSGNCLICEYGRYPFNSTCKLVSPLCGNHNVQTGACISCFNQLLTLQDGKCIDANCLTYNPQDECIQCRDSYKYSNDDRICIFRDPNCLEQRLSECLRCQEGYFILAINRTCLLLPPNCNTSSPLDATCIYCKPNYILMDNGDCLLNISIPKCLQLNLRARKCDQCQEGYTGQVDNAMCIQKQCINFSASGQCLGCANSYVLDNGRCEKVIMPNITTTVTTTTTTTIVVNPTLPNFTTSTNTTTENTTQVKDRDPYCILYSGQSCSKCSVKFYLSPNSGKCVAVNPLCQTNSPNGQCSSCYKGYTLYQGNCVIELPSDPYCKIMEQAVCKECYRNFYYSISQGKCIRVNPLCLTYKLDGQCTSCYSGYSLSAGLCKVFVQDSNCKKYSNGQCEECAQTYYVSAGQCIKVSNQCETFNERSGLCTSCYEGFTNKNGKCVEGIQDKFCRLIQGNKCTLCYPGYFLNNQGVCMRANIKCRTYNPSNGSCTSCYDGYILDQQDCIVNIKNDPNCKTNRNGICEQCYFGYIAIKGQCTVQNPLCRTIDTTNGDCLTCWQGYSLHAGDCLTQTQINTKEGPVTTDAIEETEADLYCITYQGQTCKQCSYGFYLSQEQRKCKLMNPLCQTNDLNNGKCLSCYKGYVLEEGMCSLPTAKDIAYCLSMKKATNECEKCISGYYLSGNECRPVSILCASYEESSGKCKSCIKDHYLMNGVCIFSARFDAHCVKYESSYCSQCETNYYLNWVNYSCNFVDPKCYEFDYVHNLCIKCRSGVPRGAQCQL